MIIKIANHYGLEPKICVYNAHEPGLVLGVNDCDLRHHWRYAQATFTPDKKQELLTILNGEPEGSMRLTITPGDVQEYWQASTHEQRLEVIRRLNEEFDSSVSIDLQIQCHCRELAAETA